MINFFNSKKPLQKQFIKAVKTFKKPINKTLIVEYSGLEYSSNRVIFKNTKTKNIKISIKQNLQIIVSFPKNCSFEKAQNFFLQKIIWVNNSLQKMKKRQEIRQSIAQSIVNSTDNSNINNWQNLELKLTQEQFLNRNHYLILRTRNLAELHNFKIKKVILRKQKTIWGSCSANNNISLNASLAFLSNELIDYVILHELVHTEVKNHSKFFWKRLEEVLPNCRFFDRQLKIFSPDFKGKF